MRQIADYSDEFNYRFRIFDLSTRISHFFGRQKAAHVKLEQISQKWSSKNCHVTYLPKTKSIVIYGEPEIMLNNIDECEKEIKQMISELIVDYDNFKGNRHCSFCGSISTNVKILRICGHAYCRCASNLLIQTFPFQCLATNCKTNIHIYDLQEIYEAENFPQLCKKSLEHYLKNNAHVDDRVLCPNNNCNGLINKSSVYQTCLVCGDRVCALCHIINDDLHEGRTCDQRTETINQLGNFFSRLFDASEKYAREHWTPDLPPIIRIERNIHIIEKSLSLERFYKGVTALEGRPPPDLTSGFFAFHGTATSSIIPICKDGFDPQRRKGQVHGIGEYFGVNAAISHGYCRETMGNGIKTMIVAFILYCNQVSTKPGFCHIVNNPIDWSYAYNLPVSVISYGRQMDAPLIFPNSILSVTQSVPLFTENTTASSIATNTQATSTRVIPPSTTQNIVSPSPVKKKSNSLCVVA